MEHEGPSVFVAFQLTLFWKVCWIRLACFTTCEAIRIHTCLMVRWIYTYISASRSLLFHPVVLFVRQSVPLALCERVQSCVSMRILLCYISYPAFKQWHLTNKSLYLQALKCSQGALCAKLCQTAASFTSQHRAEHLGKNVLRQKFMN